MSPQAPTRRRVRLVVTASLALALLLGSSGTALACGGLVAPNGTINLVRTTTLAAYHRGVEHYVTSFEFAGDGSGEVGSIVPLPGVPTRVTKGGDWTLQRLVLETQPPVAPEALFAADGGLAVRDAEVLLETQIDALDITVLRGGAVAVGTWAREHGFFLPPDAPEVLEFYAARSPIFMAARFDLARAEDQGVRRGEGTPIHVAIPTPNPWVPLRILALGRQPTEVVEADVYLLTDTSPATLPQAVRPNGDPEQRGLIQLVSDPASPSLLADLRSDRGMRWLPDEGMWLTQIRVQELARNLVHDLAIDASGFGRPDPVAAGFSSAAAVGIARGTWPGVLLGVLAGVSALVGAFLRRRRALGGPAV